MHATVLVLGEDIETLMEPYSEHDPDAVEPIWDWWIVGGRWAGSLLATDASGQSVTNPPYGDIMTSVAAGQPCDQVRRGSLDIEALRRRAVENAEQVWTKAEPVLAKHGCPKSRVQMRAQAQVGILTSEAWEEWRSQPGMSELLEHVGFSDDPGELFSCTREEFIERARQQALCEYAFLSEETGWMDSRTYNEHWEPMSTPGYAERVNRVIEQASADTLVSLVDYHS